MPESLRFDCNGEAAAQAAMQALVRQGLHVVRSFDLHSALDAHAHGESLPCGPEQSIGPFVVLLVYSNPTTSSGRAPVVVTSQGRDGQAETQIVQDTNCRLDECLVARVWGALQEAARSVQPTTDLVAKEPAGCG
jgi:hypothetical protein